MWAQEGPLVIALSSMCSVKLVLLLLTASCLSTEAHSLHATKTTNSSRATGATNTNLRELFRTRQQQSSAPSINYGVVVDCGSSGTRATIYTWPRGTKTGELAYKIQPLKRAGQLVSVRIRPGLASVRDQPSRAGDYMRPIMEFVSDNVPAVEQAAAPIYFLGTAGLRLLEADERELIMENLRTDLARAYPNFKRIQCRVISGLEEAVFQWVSVNALARRLTHQFDLPEGSAVNLFLRANAPQHRRWALLEMGGASAQLAFEVSSSLNELMARRLLGEPRAWRVYQTSGMDLNLYGDPEQDASVFAVSFLGFGSDSARSLATDLLVRESLQSPALLVGNSPASLKWPLLVLPNSTLVLQDPCLPAGARETIIKPIELLYEPSKSIGYTLGQGKRAESETFAVRLLGAGSYKRCQLLLNRVALTARAEETTCNVNKRGSKDEICEAPLIGSNIVPWMRQFQFIGLGELFYTTASAPFNMSGPVDGPQFQIRTLRLCATSWRDIETQYPARGEFERRRNLLACFKATWLLTWLTTVLRMPLVRSSPASALDFRTADQVEGVEVDWKLGAMITRAIELNEYP